MTYARPLAALAALLCAAACSTFRPGSHPGRESLLSDQPAPGDRSCRAAAEPARLPPVSALVDSAGLSAAVADAWRAAERPPGYVLVALRYDREGLNVRRDVIEHRVTPWLADSVQKLVFAHRGRARPAEREWGVRLRIDPGEQPVLRVGRMEACAAQLAERGAAGFAGAMFGDVRDRGAPVPLAGGEHAYWVRVELDRGGNVTDARLERAFGRSMAEQRVLGYVYSLQFLPATEDGAPVPSRLVFPLRLRL